MEQTHICGAATLSDVSTGARKIIFSKRWRKIGLSVENKTDGTTNRNQDSNSVLCKPTLACISLGSSSAMLTIVMDLKTMTQSVPISSLNIVNGTSAGQGTWRCGLPAKFIDRVQMSVQKLMALKGMPHKTLDEKNKEETTSFLSDLLGQG